MKTINDDKRLDSIKVKENSKPIADSNSKYDEVTLNMFYQRREKHIAGLSRSYSAEEAMNIIKNGKF